MARSVDMPNLQSNDRFPSGNVSRETGDGSRSLGEDQLMEQILQNLNTTPLGQVLKQIACLSEIRQGKVMSVRRQITVGAYDLGDRLDTVVDRVLEDLTA